MSTRKTSKIVWSLAILASMVGYTVTPSHGADRSVMQRQYKTVEEVEDVHQIFDANVLQGEKIGICDLSLDGRIKVVCTAFRPFKKYAVEIGYSQGKTMPTSTFVKSANALVGINAGYFNLSDGKSASYVYKDKSVIADPHDNRALCQNASLAPYLPQIFGRSELRLTQDGKSSKFGLSIARHDAPLPKGTQLISSIQAGPALLPTLTARQEAFLRTESGATRDSIGVLRKAGRTAIGLTQDELVILISVAGSKQDEFSHGLTLDEMARLFKSLGAVSALNFDGGTSTTLALSGALSPDGQPRLAVGRTPETRVASVLLVVPAN